MAAPTGHDAPSPPTVLLTGGNGFVGSRVARRLLARGHRVRAIVRRAGAAPELRHPLTEEIEGDFIDPAVARRAAEGCGLVVHCAATAGPDPETVRRVNVDGTRSVLEAALAAGATRYIHVSTLSVYAHGDAPAVDEDAPLETSGHPYGVTKAEGDRLVLEAIRGGFRATILRPGAILGVHPTSTWAVKVPQRIRDRQVKLRIDGQDLLPWVHVEDLVDSVLLAIADDRATGRVYNMADGHVTWRRYTDDVRAWFGTPPLDVIPREEVPAGDYWAARYDAGRIRVELGYAPRRSYEEGMEEARLHWRQAPAP
jgi:nucleoside-diphosphate-sugar epimerase